MPVPAVRAGGRPTVSAGSRITCAGSIFGWKITFFVWVAMLVMTPARPTSEPVPANWKTGGYLEKAPKDPWGHDYLYLQPGLKGEIDVMSYGADGQPGGEGYDADLGSWML